MRPLAERQVLSKLGVREGRVRVPQAEAEGKGVLGTGNRACHWEPMPEEVVWLLVALRDSGPTLQVRAS